MTEPPRSDTLDMSSIPFRSLVTFLVLLEASCSAPPPATPPPATLAPQAAPRATATAPAAPSPAAAQAPIDPAADADELAFARSICQAAVKHDRGKVRVGCQTCPPFDGKAEADQPDGRVAVDPEAFWAIEHLYHGAFVEPGADEVAAVFEGCEPHAMNFGGTLFARKTAAGYRAITYASAFHPASCQVYHRPDRRDELVCDWFDAHQTMGFTQILAYDAARATGDDPLKAWDALATVNDNSGGVCFGVSPDVGVKQGKVVGYRFEDRNGDHVPDLLVDVLHRATPYSAATAAAIQKKCREAAAAGREEPTMDVPALLGQPVKETLELLFDGERFKPTPKTAALIRRL